VYWNASKDTLSSRVMMRKYVPDAPRLNQFQYILSAITHSGLLGKRHFALNVRQSSNIMYPIRGKYSNNTYPRPRTLRRVPRAPGADNEIQGLSKEVT